MTFMCDPTCFGRLSAHHQERTTALEASGFTCWKLAVGALLVVVLPDHDQQRSNRHAPKVKPEASSAVLRS
jgi:hypothetical protein